MVFFLYVFSLTTRTEKINKKLRAYSRLKGQKEGYYFHWLKVNKNFFCLNEFIHECKSGENNSKYFPSDISTSTKVPHNLKK